MLLNIELSQSVQKPFQRLFLSEKMSDMLTMCSSHVETQLDMEIQFTPGSYRVHITIIVPKDRFTVTQQVGFHM